MATTPLQLQQPNMLAMLRQQIPNLVINCAAPFVVYQLAAPHTTLINALLLSSIPPTLYALGELLRKRRIDFIAVLVILGLIFSIATAFLLKDPKLLLLRQSAVTGLIGVVFMISVLFPKPMLYYAMRTFFQHQPALLTHFEARWNNSQYSNFFRLATALMGAIMIVDVAMQAIMIYTLPISFVLSVGSLISTIFMITAMTMLITIIRRKSQAFARMQQIKK